MSTCIAEELASLRTQRGQLRGAANKKARYKLNQKIRALEAALEIDKPTVKAHPAAEVDPEIEPETEQHHGEWVTPGNYVPSSAPGCHVVRFDADWIVGTAPFMAEDFGLQPGDVPPDVSIDPDDSLLTVINSSAEETRSYCVTVWHRLRDATGQLLQQGIACDNDKDASPSSRQQCTTLLLVISPTTVMDVCYVDLPEDAKQDLSRVQIESDVKQLCEPIECSNLPSLPVYRFPLLGEGPFLCSQGCGGWLTHRFRETYYALDFECAVGTPVVALDDGTIAAIEDGRDAGGIAVGNLFRWNSLMLRLVDGHFVEYVHIRAHSARVSVGDTVMAGQVLCESGAVGFCPTPHLHIQLHETDERTAPTVGFGFRGRDTNENFYPVAGQCYGPNGCQTICSPCKKPATAVV